MSHIFHARCPPVRHRYFSFNQAKAPLNRLEKVMQRNVPAVALGLGDTWARTMGDCPPRPSSGV